MDVFSVYDTLEAAGNASGCKLDGQLIPLHPPTSVDEVRDAVHGITVDPKPVSDHLALAPGGVRGNHSQCVVTVGNTRHVVAAIRTWRRIKENHCSEELYVIIIYIHVYIYNYYYSIILDYMGSECCCSYPVYVCGCLSVPSSLPPHTSRTQNIGTYGFTVTWNFFLIVVFAKNALSRSEGVIFLLAHINNI